MNRQIHPSYAQFRERQSQPGAANSCTEDYRSVIDDLTIENKKLKEKLRKYEKLHAAHLEKDKLFEVKIHALPAAKRRDLEDTLRNFASRIDGSRDEAPRITTSRPPLAQEPTSDSDMKDQASGSSHSRPGDSGYASMPNSGPTSTSTNNNGAPNKKSKSAPQATKDENIRSFLKDIPAGLLIKHNVSMTERQKKKLVVKRLEQLFTGKVKGTIACHNQTLQQQEVSKSAARAEQTSMHGAPVEGLREANILQSQANDNLEPAGLSAQSSPDPASPNPSRMDLVSSPEQRPTRPLDLDPDREQVPFDNMEYLHHMGVNTAQAMTEDLSDVEPEADGWIFLNLLINMAQLHIMNVTPDFVRSAVADVSAKFQLSKDGQQIRWRGGQEGTRLSSDSDNSSPTGKRVNEDDDADESHQKRQKLAGQSTNNSHFASVPQKLQDPAPNTRGPTKNDPFHYKPLFARAFSSDDNMSDGDVTSNRGSPAYEVSERTRTRLGHRHSASSTKRIGDGPIAFYSGAKFCTDLSSDRASIATPFHSMGIGKDGYSNFTDSALGCVTQRPMSLQRTISGSLLRSRPFKDYSISDPFRTAKSRPLTLVGKGDSDEEPLLSMNMEWSTDASSDAPLLDLNASGLGGTHPADHFVYTVRTKRTKREATSSRELTRPFLNRKMSTAILDLFQERQSNEDITNGMASMSAFSTKPKHSHQAENSVRTEILDVKLTKLRPSRLPEPSAYYEAMSTTDSDASSDDSSSSGLEKYRQLIINNHWTQAAFEIPDVHSPSAEMSDEDDEEGESESDEDSDDSIDMLAHLRAADPAAVAAQEAEFAMELDQPGSSAATVGGRTENVSSSSYESRSGGSYESSD